MLSLHFDFRTLKTRQAFYDQLVAQSACDLPFGDNLDALWDWLTAGIALPASVTFCHADEMSHELLPLVAVIEDAAAELDGALRVNRLPNVR